MGWKKASWASADDKAHAVVSTVGAWTATVWLMESNVKSVQSWCWQIMTEGDRIIASGVSSSAGLARERAAEVMRGALENEI